MTKKYDEIRFHGRGGQGIVTASALLSQAVFYEGKYPQSMPLYGPQRRGAPVVVYLRVGEKEIDQRSFIHSPHYVVILDDSLIEIANVTQGVPSDGFFLVNTPHTSREPLGLAGSYNIAGVDADEIAYRLKMGGPPYPHINTLMLAALAKVTGLVSLESVIQATKDKYPPLAGDLTEQGMREAFERVVVL